jgi:hypothetical protein
MFWHICWLLPGGNLGHPGGYTSYDYAAVISEERLVDREKYSEAKLEANFIQASPAYLTAKYQNNTNVNGSYTGNADLAVTALYGNVTKFFVVRHAAFNSLEDTDYSITLPTSQGNISIPQLGGKLSLNGRDSKYHVTDYDLGGVNLLYSSAEIFTWKKYGDKTVLVVYGGPNEEHELAVSDAGKAETIEGSDVTISTKNGATVLHYTTSSERRIVKLENGLYVYLLGRLLLSIRKIYLNEVADDHRPQLCIQLLGCRSAQRRHLRQLYQSQPFDFRSYRPHWLLAAHCRDLWRLYSLDWWSERHIAYRSHRWTVKR